MTVRRRAEAGVTALFESVVGEYRWPMGSDGVSGDRQETLELVARVLDGELDVNQFVGRGRDR